MRTMKQTIFVLSFFCLFGAAQETGPRRPGAADLSASARGAGEEARGTKKKDVRALVVYPENVYSPADVERIEGSVRAVVDAIASGAKLTKADAARTANAANGETALLKSIEEAMRGPRPVAVVGMTFAPSSAGNKPIACPPPGCGCDQNGGGHVSCSCALLKNDAGPFCMCIMCYDKHELTPFKTEDPVLDTTIWPKGRLAAPESPKTKGWVVVVATPPGATERQRRALTEAAVKIAQSEPWPAGHVIKTKSIPRD